MKFWLILLLSFAAHGVARAQSPAEELEPGVKTSPTITPAPATTPASTPAPAPTPAADAARKPASAPKAPRAGGGRAQDRVDLDATQITGNRELPKVLYIVPWKRPDLGDLPGRPLNSLLDEVLAPVDRDVFRRETRYFDALRPDQAKPQTAAPDAPAPATPATPAPAELRSGSQPALPPGQ
jgi:hypothetical protein